MEEWIAWKPGLRKGSQSCALFRCFSNELAGFLCRSLTVEINRAACLVARVNRSYLVVNASFRERTCKGLFRCGSRNLSLQTAVPEESYLTSPAYTCSSADINQRSTFSMPGKKLKCHLAKGPRVHLMQ